MSAPLFVRAAVPTDGVQHARETFRQAFGSDATGVWSAPGRLNIIGEHVDYSGGPCLPIALPHRAYLALSARTDRKIRLVSAQSQAAVTVLHLDDIGPKGSAGEVSGWSAYLAGVAWALEEEYGRDHPGFDAALWSCVPQGGGLSSSAAIECSLAVALDEVWGIGLAGSSASPHGPGRTHLAHFAIRAENEVAGARTGGLDQNASLRCRQGHALALDCRDFSARDVPFDLAADGLEILIIDTQVSHSLADGHYAARRADCEEAARILGVHQLVDVDDVEAAMRALDSQRLRRRVRHVLSEIARTRAFGDLLDAGALTGTRRDVARLLLDDSHDSLRDDFEVSCPQLDVAVDTARAVGAYGSRMTGGGFGGSAFALVTPETTQSVTRAVVDAYDARGWHSPRFIQARPSGPAAREDE
ncbi:galactokinase [Schaalia sp. ZJ1691]|uniref:galactokinase n=1 Tax=Schaalia sp. ZJ1691 TaxID=2709404 RepID=UPI0013EADB48|nr:galactokinase [Schaalia sp. ZJ1691]